MAFINLQNGGTFDWNMAFTASKGRFIFFAIHILQISH